MKKLIVAFAAATIAVVANAAAVDWQASINAPSTITLANYTAYMLDAGSWSTYVDGTKLDNEYLSKALDSATFYAQSASKDTTGTQTFTTSATSVDYKMILVDSANKTWAVLKEGTVASYDPESGAGVLQSGSTTGARILGTATSGNLAWGEIKSSTPPGPEPAPEPTSGLLLLLGMAGLALRRKQK